MSRPFQERFWEKVEVKEADDCWEWTRALNHAGYGKFSVATSKHDLAHRVSWKLVNGDIPYGLFVLHKCDNPKCVNPWHLFLGTQTDNMMDAFNKKRNKGTSRPCDQNPNAKLTREQVIDILEAGKTRYYGMLTSLAKRYNVSVTAISYILKGKAWTRLKD